MYHSVSDGWEVCVIFNWPDMIISRLTKCYILTQSSTSHISGMGNIVAPVRLYVPVSVHLTALCRLKHRWFGVRFEC